MITSLIILLVILNIYLSHIVAKTSEKKGIRYGKIFWASFLFSPLIGLLLLGEWYRDNLEEYTETIIPIMVVLVGILVIVMYFTP